MNALIEKKNKNAILVCIFNPYNIIFKCMTYVAVILYFTEYIKTVFLDSIRKICF